MIYVSTGGYKSISFLGAIEELSKAGITAFELSGGKFSLDAPKKISALSKKFHLVLHNYFPPPENPFVLNLASMRDDIAGASMDHVLQAIEISHLIGAKFYSFHAGYLIDPPSHELGFEITKTVINDREEALHLFIARANKLAAYAEGKGVKLLVENNVLSSANYDSFGKNPFLMVDTVETEKILTNSHNNLGLLIDVAHLKVSANTLDFSKSDFLSYFKNSISGYHFSDNSGLADSNDDIEENSWFWPFINRYLNYYSLEVYNKDPKNLVKQLELIRKKTN